ncbi:MAG: hypothetical protein M4579_001667 [Chaenotheca gracillima]|nr:MAG: hypothetical protein M4579_001667 [Chaenotheca gracillima]
MVLSVQGMLCPNDELKLARSFRHIHEIRNFKVNLALSQAELDVNLEGNSLDDFVRRIHSHAEFSCTVLENNEQCLDVENSEEFASLVNRKLPPGVTDIIVLNTQTVRIHYNARTTSVRRLIGQGFGLPLKLADLQPDPAIDASAKHTIRMGYMTLLSAFLTVPVLVLAWAPLPKRPVVYGSVSLALATIIQIFVAGPIYLNAFRGLFSAHRIEVDFLVVLSTSTAYVFSLVSFIFEVQGRPLSTGDFFETSTLLVTFITLARYVSALAQQKAIESISVQCLQPSSAIIVDTATGEEREIDTRLLQYGDVFKVPPECWIATDGTVISGETEVDESMVTGEARPVHKSLGSSVVAGTINSNGKILVRLSNLPGDNSITKIANMVEEAKLSKPRTQEIADRVAGYFVPTILALTIITFVSWTAVGLKVRGMSPADAVIKAVTYAIAVLIVSCPCAIVLAVPMVIIIGGGVAAKQGVIIKSGKTMEMARNATHVVFDKTGTLTLGEMNVRSEEFLGEAQDETKSALLGLLSNSRHPVSLAIAKHLDTAGVVSTPIDDMKTVFGSGVEGSYQGRVIRAGNSRWLGLNASAQVQALLDRRFTILCVTLDETLVAIFGLTDSLRHEAHSTITSLKARGISVSIVSGDEDGAVQSIANQLLIPPSRIRSRCSPADKEAYIISLSADTNLSANDKPTIIFCGDGTNDAIALARASIGVHMSPSPTITGQSTGALARSAADVVLLRASLAGILDLIDLSRAVWWRIALNFVWSFIYNLFAVLLAAGAFAGMARVPPRFAALGEVVSVLPVILIALQLRWKSFGRSRVRI